MIISYIKRQTANWILSSIRRQKGKALVEATIDMDAVACKEPLTESVFVDPFCARKVCLVGARRGVV